MKPKDGRRKDTLIKAGSSLGYKGGLPLRQRGRVGSEGDKNFIEPGVGVSQWEICQEKQAGLKEQNIITS